MDYLHRCCKIWRPHQGLRDSVLLPLPTSELWVVRHGAEARPVPRGPCAALPACVATAGGAACSAADRSQLNQAKLTASQSQRIMYVGPRPLA